MNGTLAQTVFLRERIVCGQKAWPCGMVLLGYRVGKSTLPAGSMAFEIRLLLPVRRRDVIVAPFLGASALVEINRGADMVRVTRRTGLALLASLALHGCFLLFLWFLPGPTRGSVDVPPEAGAPEISLSLAAFPTVPPASTPTSSQEQQDSQMDFSVSVREDASSPGDLVSLPPPVVLSGGSTRHGAGTSLGGSGTQTGPPSLLESPRGVRRVVYVLDRSLSMGLNGALRRARREVLSALACLPKQATFQVIVYNRHAELLRVDGRSGFLTADETTRLDVAAALGGVVAAGNTDHLRALQQALQLRPDILFLVTDADDLSEEVVRRVTHLNAGYSVIHTVELSHRREAADGPLRQLAALNQGTYRHAPPGD
jgi:hypothetical protein